MDVIARRLELAYSKENADAGIGMMALRDAIPAQARIFVIAVFGAAFCLRLIACTNLANHDSLLAPFSAAVVNRKTLTISYCLRAGSHTGGNGLFGREQLARVLPLIKCRSECCAIRVRQNPAVSMRTYGRIRSFHASHSTDRNSTICSALGRRRTLFANQRLPQIRIAEMTGDGRRSVASVTFKIFAHLIEKRRPAAPALTDTKLFGIRAAEVKS